ncbi:MAG: hypothetical protein M3Z04_10630, partial [Chloroflexota bacterium]|nr:hypothetical protein [Chloroflexota bacterium]
TYPATLRNQRRMEWVQAQLQTNLGINAPLAPLERSAYDQAAQQPATAPQTFWQGWCEDYPDPYDWLSVLFRAAGPWPIYPNPAWADPTFARLTHQADGEHDPARRVALYQQAHQVLIAAAPAVLIYRERRGWLIAPRVGGLADHLAVHDLLIPGISNLQRLDIQR